VYYCIVYQCNEQTDTHTETQTMLLVTSVAIGGIYALHAMQPKNMLKVNRA